MDEKQYVEKRAALNAICKACDRQHPDDKENCPQKFAGCMEFYNVFELPAADVRPVVRGKWVMSDMQEGWVTCSVCKKMKFDGRMAFSPTLFVEWGLNFCPNCGADMREE